MFPRETMRTVSDGERNYTIVFGKSPNKPVEMFDEHIYPAARRPEFEKLKCDVAGYVISGELTLEVKGSKRRSLRPGDAFYVDKGTEHRGYAAGEDPVRLVTVCHPSKY